MGCHSLLQNVPLQHVILVIKSFDFFFLIIPLLKTCQTFNYLPRTLVNVIKFSVLSLGKLDPFEKISLRNSGYDGLYIENF